MSHSILPSDDNGANSSTGICSSEFDAGQANKHDTYVVDLLRRAISQSDHSAWKTVQNSLNETVREWLECHPKRDMAFHLDSAEHYVAGAFERFYAAASNQQVEFNTLAVALHYLQASLNSIILEKLRAASRPRELPSIEQGSSAKYIAADSENSKVWNMLKNVLSNPREQRLAYLLLNCGLKPKDIVNSCPKEFSDVREISRLRCSIIKRLLDHVEQLD